MAVDSTGDVYVADTNNHRIQKFRFGPADTVDPTVDLRTPAADEAFVVDSTATADFSCDDTGGSGLDTCVGTLADGATIDTSNVGEYTFTVTARDHAANETVVTHTYRVVAASSSGVGGTVTDSVSSDPIPGARVVALNPSDFSIAGGAVADGAGGFLAGLPVGSYYLYVIDPTGAHTAGFHGPPTTVTVTAGAATDADPVMVPSRGSVTATVTESGSGSPIGGVWGLALSPSPANPGGTELVTAADSTGQLTLAGLRPGTHYVGYVDPTGGHATRFFPNSWSVPDSTPVTVAAGRPTVADASLPAQTPVGTGAVISGTVTEAGGSTPLAGAHVVALRAADYAMARGAVTDAQGRYSLDVVAGDYKLAVFDSTGRHDMEWFDDIASADLAQAVTVTAPATADAAVAANTGTIGGTIIDDTSTNPVEGAWVLAIAPNGTLTCGSLTDADGTYTMTGLAPGNYRVTIVDPTGSHTQEYYDNSATYNGATPVTVTAAATATVNAAIGHP